VPDSIQYMIDESGTKTSAIVPIRTWEKINENHQKLKNKLNLLIGLKAGLLETKEVKKTGKKLQTRKDFLNESSR